jgi:hypothetical protein
MGSGLASTRESAYVYAENAPSQNVDPAGLLSWSSIWSGAGAIARGIENQVVGGVLNNVSIGATLTNPLTYAKGLISALVTIPFDMLYQYIESNGGKTKLQGYPALKWVPVIGMPLYWTTEAVVGSDEEALNSMSVADRCMIDPNFSQTCQSLQGPTAKGPPMK